MLMFTLAISCLTTSNLPLFMDLTFQVPMQCCSLQHQILLPLPVTSTAGCCFYFGSIPSLFLELFLHWYLVTYWDCTNLESSSFSVLSLPFYAVHEVLKLKILKWFATPFSIYHVLSELPPMTHPSWVALYVMAYSLIELDKAVVHVVWLVTFLCLWFSVCLLSDEAG